MLAVALGEDIKDMYTKQLLFEVEELHSRVKDGLWVCVCGVGTNFSLF